MAVSIRRGDGLWWDGRRFTAEHEVFLLAQGTTSWRYLLAGSAALSAYTIHVRATDRLGNVTPAGSYATVVFRLTRPARPVITAHPDDPTASRDATFRFTDATAGVRFGCRIDDQPLKECASPVSYPGLADGPHTFYVTAVNATGNFSRVARFTWQITGGTGPAFAISGDAPGTLLPGAPATPIPVTLTNPGSAPITVTDLTAALAPASLPAGCDSAWFQFTQSSVSPTNPVSVPAGGSVTLPTQGASAPTLQLIDSGTNQDACQNAHLTLTYTGNAHS